MSDPFVAEVRLFAGNFAPLNWAFCDGQLLPISQNTALFSLVGTTYGGDGRTTFGLPNLQDRSPMHPGNGPGLTPRRIGETGGSRTVTLHEAQSAHNHLVSLDDSDADSGDPAAKYLAPSPLGDEQFQTDAANPVTMDGTTIQPTGGGQPHNNLPPYLGLYFIIALQGTYPSRS